MLLDVDEAGDVIPRARRTLSALSGLPLELSTLLRSHSSSRRRHPSDYEMTLDNDRPTSRKSRFENKIYNFLTRSRSRSRSKSKNGRVPYDDEPVPDLPPIHSASKPPARIPSRPLSSTTTATNTTAIPGTPRPKQRPAAIPVPPLPTRPETPKPSGTRKTLHNLFGIPLSSPKRSSFSSSRRPSCDSIMDDLYDPTPKPRKSYSPHPNSRTHSPTPPSKRPANASLSSTATSTTSTSSRLHKFFIGHKTPPRTAPSPDDVSGPLRRPSLSSRHRASSTESHSRGHLSPDSTSSQSKLASDKAPPPVPPKIIHTPATPQNVHPDHNQSHRMRSLDSGYRHRMGERMAAVDETGVVRGSGKGKERDLGGAAPASATSRMKTAHGRGTAGRSTKHGSFDFERPGWSTAGAIKRSGSGGTTASGVSEAGTGTSGWSRTTNGFLRGIRESAMGPGLAGVGTLQRDQSLKRAKERDEMIKRAREDERNRREQEKAEKERNQPHRSASRGTPQPDTDEYGGGTSTSTNGKTSSLGRKRGALLRDGSLRSKQRTHGRFAFEPPVSNSTRSNKSTSTGGGVDAQLSISWAGGAELQKENTRLKGELERVRNREKDRKHHPQRDRAPVPVPNVSVGHRSGAKGRSLDLGLGLAWAPTKLKEEALLPSSGFFARSVSGASSQPHGVDRSVSESSHASGEKEKSKVAREVNDVFQNALDDEGYAAFKKYVHRFDAHDIPFDGPNGIVARVERLLRTAPDLSEDGKRRLLDSFVRIVLQNA